MKKIYPLILVIIISACSSKARFRSESQPSTIHKITHTYDIIEQDRACGKEPLVRLSSFEYDASESLSISIYITTSTSEKAITGSLTFLLDEVEIQYQGDIAHKQYTETLEVEDQARNPRNIPFRGGIFTRALLSTISRKPRNISIKQYWNTCNINVETQDVLAILQSKDLAFIIETETCDIMAYPTYNQVEELSEMLNRSIGNY